MFVSERFLGRLARLRKSHHDAPTDEQVELVREAFVAMLSELPAEMVTEVFEAFTDRIRQRAQPDARFLDEARYLSDIADLFALQYDEEHDPVHEDDWPLIGEIVNDYALDLDMPTVNYVMRLVVDHHAL